MTPNRFKFRAWDKSKKKMVTDFQLESNGCVHYRHAQTAECWFTIMQSTGLADKSGKEIFEGDIVMLDAFTPTAETVEWVDSAWCLTHQNLSIPIEYTVIESSYGNHATIIGNIYEHPHLLGK